jgi:nicotinamidase-related amidase
MVASPGTELVGGRTVVNVDLEVPVPGPVTVDAARTLLVLVDMENEFCHPDGQIYLGQAAVDAVQATATLLERARRESWRVLWVRSERDADAVEFTRFGRKPHLIRGTWATEYTDPLSVAPGETVMPKTSHDCFARTGLDAWLQAEGVLGPDWTVLVVGVALGVCVNHAVLGFSVRDYRVAVVLDCTAPNEGPSAAATLWRYGMHAYDYNIAVTRSDLLNTVPSGAA